MKYPFGKILLSGIVGAVSFLPAFSETVSQKEAKDLAQKFFDQAFHESTAPVKLVYNGKRLTTDRLFTPFYVYNQPRGGFVIISAENKTYPILAFSLKSDFNPDDLTDSERAWLKGYARDIELIRYDSQRPENAIKAWQNYNAHIEAILNAPYDVTDPTISLDSAYAGLNDLVYTQDNSRDGEFSALYTPDQWREMITGELDSKGNVAIGIVDERKDLYPAIAHGRKGDFFRLRFERPNDWLMLLTAAEFLGDREVALLDSPDYVAPLKPEETPFEFHDSFMMELAAAEKRMEEDVMKIQNEPEVTTTGAGHFDVLLPENARLAMLYNMNGSHIGRVTYSGQPVAHINIESEPAGFYFAVIFGESGKPYSIKLYR